jgi:hypothetical protein
MRSLGQCIKFFLNVYFNEFKNRSPYNVYTSNENKIIKLTICRTCILTIIIVNALYLKNCERWMNSFSFHMQQKNRSIIKC